MNSPFFSIIIPVYNAVKYLGDCVESILAQSYCDFEVLLIDDGSTDGSAALCDELTQKDARIKCLHVANGGPSRARNLGFKMATGKYVFCVDDDDKILRRDFFAEVAALLAEKEVDLIQTGATYYRASTDEVTKSVDYRQFPDINKFSAREIIATLIRKHVMQISCWTKFIRRDFLIAHTLYFDESLIVEDMEWCLRLWQAVETMRVFQNADYCHIYRDGSIASGESPRTIKCREDQIATIGIGLKLLEKEADNSFATALLTYLNYQFFITLHSISVLKSGEKKRLLKALLQYDRVTKYQRDKQVKIIARLYHAFGVSGALFGMKLYTWLLRPTTRVRIGTKEKLNDA